MNLSGKNLSIVSINPKVKELNLRHNKITTLHNWPRKLELVEKMWLDYNNISDLESFPRCPNLSFLSLTHNDLRKNLIALLSQLFTKFPNIF